MKLRYFSHSAFQITTDDEKIILIDPFLDDNPTSPVKSDEIERADYIILTHGHGDHIGDSFKIADKEKTEFIWSLVICFFWIRAVLNPKFDKLSA